MTKCDKCKDPDYLEAIFKHCQLDPETQAWERRVAYFFRANPKIVGLSYTAADVLRLEKNLKIRNAAISIIHDEIKKRRNSDLKKYSFIRRKVTEEQVREILNEQRILIDGTSIQREKLLKRKEVKETETLYPCPLCKGLIPVIPAKRDNVVSLRITEDLDDSLTWLAMRVDIPRSLLVSALLEYSIKFSRAIL